MTTLYHYTMCGLDNVWLENGYRIDNTPYGESVHIEDPDGLDRAIACTLLKHGGTLHGKELRFIRQLLGLSQADLGQFLGKDAQSIARWEKSGTVEPTAERLARLVFSSYFDGDESIKAAVATLNMMDRTVNEQLVLTENDGDWQPVTPIAPPSEEQNTAMCC